MVPGQDALLRAVPTPDQSGERVTRRRKKSGGMVERQDWRACRSQDAPGGGDHGQVGAAGHVTPCLGSEALPLGVGVKNLADLRDRLDVEIVIVIGVVHARRLRHPLDLEWVFRHLRAAGMVQLARR